MMPRDSMGHSTQYAAAKTMRGASSSSSKAAAKGHANSTKAKFKKAPGAPKRFKSGFMFFSEHHHKAIREEHADIKIRAADAAKMVSRAWKELVPEEREKYMEMARLDRIRFEKEKATYKGPWRIPVIENQHAPKKPMSAYLAFGNERRKSISEANPLMTNSEISSLLSKLWKECPAEVKQAYRDREAQERQAFKEYRAEWERQQDQTLLDQAEEAQRHESYLTSSSSSSLLEESHDDVVRMGESRSVPITRELRDEAVASLPIYSADSTSIVSHSHLAIPEIVQPQHQQQQQPFGLPYDEAQYYPLYSEQQQQLYEPERHFSTTIYTQHQHQQNAYLIDDSQSSAYQARLQQDQQEQQQHELHQQEHERQLQFERQQMYLQQQMYESQLHQWQLEQAFARQQQQQQQPSSSSFGNDNAYFHPTPVPLPPMDDPFHAQQHQPNQYHASSQYATVSEYPLAHHSNPGGMVQQHVHDSTAATAVATEHHGFAIPNATHTPATGGAIADNATTTNPAENNQHYPIDELLQNEDLFNDDFAPYDDN